MRQVNGVAGPLLHRGELEPWRRHRRRSRCCRRASRCPRAPSRPGRRLAHRPGRRRARPRPCAADAPMKVITTGSASSTPRRDVDQQHRAAGRPGTRRRPVGRQLAGDALERRGLVTGDPADDDPVRRLDTRCSSVITPSNGASTSQPAQPAQRGEPPVLLLARTAPGGRPGRRNRCRAGASRAAPATVRPPMWEWPARPCWAAACVAQLSRRVSPSSVSGHQIGQGGCAAHGQPTAPSICSSISRFSSSAYSIGSSRAIGSTKPRTIIAIASSSVRPRLIR